MPAEYVAIITDGNGRWAQQRGLPVIEGHRAGADNVKERLRDAVDLGIKELTVYSFSTENWTRPREEVEGLMGMFGERIDRETPELNEEGVRMRFIGRRDGVSEELTGKMDWAEEETGPQRPNHALRRLQLRRSRRDPGRGRALPGGRGGELPGEPVCARDARSRPPHQNQRRAAALQLPALAVRVFRVRLPRRALAGLRPRGVRGLAGGVRGTPAALRGAVMIEDLDPPSFQFGRGRGERDPEEPIAREPEFAEVEPFGEADPFGEDERFAEEEPFAEPEIVVRRVGEDEKGGGRRRFRLLPEMSETSARIVVAIPWIIFAIAIVGVGGDLFMAALVVLAILGLREFFVMAKPEEPILLPGYAVTAGMVIAAHYGEAFQILLVFAVIFPRDLPVRGRPSLARGDHHLDRVHDPRRRLDGARLLPCRAAARPAHPRRRAADRRPRGHIRERHRRLRRGQALRDAQDHATNLAQQDARGADRRLPRAPPWVSGSPASTRTGCPASMR